MYFIVYLTYTITYNAAKIQNNIEYKEKMRRNLFLQVTCIWCVNIINASK